MKIWLGISYLALVLALAGCVEPQPYQQINAFDQKRWNSIMVPESSGQNTNMGIWMSMQGGG
jgi:hypothetical protein